MKSIVLAAGHGERLQDISKGNKCMLLLNGKPVLNRSLSYAESIGVDEIILVVGYRAEDIINDYGLSFKDIPIRYVIQKEQNGIVNAIDECRELIGSDDFLLLLGDEIISNPNHIAMKKYFDKHRNVFILCGVVSIKNTSRISETYSILTVNQQIYRLIEKPSFTPNDLMGTGNCFFRHGALDYISLTPVNKRRGREEKELVDLIQCAVDDGKQVEWFTVGKKYENVNSESCLLNILNTWNGGII